MKKYVIGIDTGGTFTDAVLLDKESEKVVHSAKVATTHHKLALGTGRVIGELLKMAQISRDEVARVGVSSTLATNSVVENKGARVGLFVIGYVKHFKLPVKAVLFLEGGHTITGEEEQPLDIDYLVNLLPSLKNEVDAYGVCSAMSMKNPTHELVAEKAISMLDPKPVFCSHRISQQAGMQERAATAGLHAKLMPIMKEYMEGVQEAMEENNLQCPLIVIGGNGEAISVSDAIGQAGLTVASGPACTASFGAQSSGGNCLVIDIGGTTTDIAMVEDGKPLLSPEGCTIGDWRTHVEAIDMFTRGIGGDSLVHLNEKGDMTVGPTRVEPLALSKFPLEVEQWIGPRGRVKCIRLREGVVGEKNETVLRYLREKGPATLETLAKATGYSGIPLEKELEKLTREQLICETGFTPTDALHVLGLTSIGDTTKSLEGATVLGKVMGVGPREFSEAVIVRTEEMIENLIIEFIVHKYWGSSLAQFINGHQDNPVLGVNFSLKIPMVGVGASAGYFLPNIARKLSTSVTFPDNYEVGNAMGAALLCIRKKG